MPREVENRLIGQFYQLLSQIYMSEAVPKALRIAVKPVARHELVKQEKALNKAGYNGKLVRPAPGADPALRVIELELGKMQEEGKLQNVSLYISTETDSATIDNLSLSITSESEGGGSFSSAGREWERQDDSREDVRSNAGEIVSNKQALYL